MAVVEVKNASKSYSVVRSQPGLTGVLTGFFRREVRTVEAVRNITFAIEAGELVGFLGPNGAGKTTTLKMLAGILTPTAGEIKVLGHTPYLKEPAYQRQFALVMGQKNSLWWDLAAMDSFKLNRDIYEIGEKAFRRNLEELAEVLNIGDILDIPVRKLSLGQRMKCEMALALLHRPKVLLLDEPTIGLDVMAQKNVRDFLKRHNQKTSTTILLTSHYMHDIEELCERVIIVDSGQIGYDGSLSDLIAATSPRKTVRLVFSKKLDSAAELERFGQVACIDGYGAEILVPRDEVRSAATALLSSDLPIEDIAIDEVRVDDVIRQVFSRK